MFQSVNDTSHMKATEQYFHDEILITLNKVLLTFQSVDEL